MNVQGYLIAFVLFCAPLGLIGAAVYRNSVGLGLLGILAALGVISLALWFLAQLNTDL